MKKLKSLIVVVALLAFTLTPAFSQEAGILWTRGVKHITTKTTTHIATSTAYLNSIVINVSGAGTSWTVTVQDLATTPDILYTATVATGTTVIALPVGLKFTGGIDVVTAGSTAGTMDVWYAFH